MTQVRLRYVHRYTDRHGKERLYLRRRGQGLVALPGKPGTPQFMRSYHAALQSPAEPIGRRPPSGTLSALAVSWYVSAAFKQLSEKTRQGYRRILEELRATHGEKPIRLLETRHLRTLVAKKSGTPAAANGLLKVLRAIMGHAMEEGLIKANPAIGVRKLRESGTGIPTWLESHIAAFEERWPLGTTPGLALALLLYTGQRRSDVVHMGRQHLRGNAIFVRQVKTKAELYLPIHPALQNHLDALPQGQLTFLITESGRPFSRAGLTDAFRGWAKDAGVPSGLTPHGLRKAAARRMAEGGCTAHQIASITGHRTLKEVERYTRAVDQESLARAAVLKMPRGKAGTQIG